MVFVTRQAKHKSIIIGEEELLYRLRTICESETSATTATEKALQRIKCNSTSIFVNLARGNPELTAESPLKLMGYKSDIDVENRIVTTVIHNLNSGSGLVKDLSGEIIVQKKIYKCSENDRILGK